MTEKQTKDNQHIIIYDGVCNLCSRLVSIIMRKDKKGKFIFLSFQSERGQLLIKRHGLAVNNVDSVVYIKSDKYLFRSSAILQIFSELGGSWKLLCIFMIIPEFIRDFIYNIIARTRYKIFGIHNSCKY